MKPAAINRRIRRVSLFVDFGSGLAGLALPLYAATLGASPAFLGLLGAAQRGAYLLLCSWSGRVADRTNPRVMAVIGAATLCFVYIAMTLTGQLNSLLGLTLMVGVATALFWPPIMAWLGQNSKTLDLERETSSFSFAWSLGVLLGVLAAGFFFDIHRALPFAVNGLVLAGAALTLLFTPYTAATPAEPIPAERAQPSPLELTGGTGQRSTHSMLNLSRGAVLAAFFSSGVAMTLFPKVGIELGLSGGMIAATISGIGVARTAAFFTLGRTHGWSGRPGVLLAGVAVSGAGVAGAAASLPLPLYFLCFAGIGLGCGLAASYSLHHALHVDDGQGRNAGIHELLLNLGLVGGALVGGFVGEWVSLAAAFWLTGGVVLIYAASAAGLRLRATENQPRSHTLG